jgi:hypothetical protein
MTHALWLQRATIERFVARQGRWKDPLTPVSWGSGRPLKPGVDAQMELGKLLARPLSGPWVTCDRMPSSARTQPPATAPPAGQVR